jgi:hypothetical protein
MKTRRLSWTSLALAWLLLAGCQDRRDPVKPTVGAEGVHYRLR